MSIQVSSSPVTVELPVHRIFIIDCSYSMCNDLPRIRESLKNKIPQITSPEDWITLIWFSSNGEFGALQTHISVKDLTDVSMLNSTIDKFIRPVGSTGFVEPINLAVDIANKFQETPQIIFMTDGGDNCWDREKILEACSRITCDNIIIEYGWYTDKDLIVKMCEKSNGAVVFNEDFDKFNGSMETYLTNRVYGKKVQIDSQKDTFAIVDGAFKVFKSTNGKCYIPENISEVHTVDSVIPEVDYLKLVYALQTKNSELTGTVVKSLGDVYFTKRISTCFTKQDYNLLQEDLIEAYRNPQKRMTKGYNPDLEVKDDVFNLIEFLTELHKDPSALYYPYMLDEKYNRISKKAKRDADFKPTTTLGSRFNLVHHSSRANISLGCKVHGYTQTESGEPVPASVFRNYTIVKDGIKNLKSLPVSFGEQMYKRLRDEDLVPSDQEWEPRKIFKVNVENIPLINKKIASSGELNLDRYVLTHVVKLILSAERKYINSRIKELTPKVETQSAAQPEHESEESTEQKDFYMTRELSVKIAKCSSLPTVNAKLLEKLNSANPKLTLSESLMKNVHQRTNGFTIEQFTEELSKVEQKLSGLSQYLESCKFAILLCGKWFSETDDSVTHDVEYNHAGDVLNFSCTISIENKKVWL
jgi:hypothetical protein